MAWAAVSEIDAAASRVSAPVRVQTLTLAQPIAGLELPAQTPDLTQPQNELAPAAAEAAPAAQEDPEPASAPAPAAVLPVAGKPSPTLAGLNDPAPNRLWARLLGWSPRNGEAPAVSGAPSSVRRGALLKKASRYLDKVLKRDPALAPTLAPYRGKIRLASFLKIAGSGLTLVSAKLIGTLVQNAMSHGVHGIAAMAALSLAVIIAGIPLRHWSDVLQETAASGAVGDLRRTVFAEVLDGPSFRSDGDAPGVLASRVKDDPSAIEQIGVRLPVRKLAAVLTLAASTVLIFTFQPVAALVVLGAFGLIQIVGKIYGRVTRKLFDDYQKKSADLNAHLVDVLENADTVLSYGRQSGEEAGLSAMLDRIRTILIKSAKIGARWQSWSDLLSVPLAFPGAFVIAVLLGLPVGAAITVAFYTSYAYGALGELTDISALTSQYSGAIADVSRLLTTAGAKTPGAAPGTIVGEVRAEALSFSYGGGPEVLDHMTFTIPAGKMTALTGPSGSGKTTLLRIIAGLAQPQSGRLLIDGVDAYKLQSPEWRAQIGWVPQDSGLMAGTIRDNMRYGKPDATDAEIEQALRSYGADFLDDVTRFPDGINTKLGPKGAGISGGQAQLVAMVRALLNHPRLLLLDEPTASLDADTESTVLRVLRELRAGKFGPPPTIVIVSHRQNVLGIADQVIRLIPENPS